MELKTKTTIISLLLIINFGGGTWAYQSGIIDSWFEEKEQAELQAKLNGFWPSDVERFEFDGMKCVQNIKQAVLTTEKINGEHNYMIGTLTCLHNSSLVKSIKIDTPSRITIKNSKGTEYLTSTKIDIGNNLTTTRHSFYIPEDKEFDIIYKIDNLEDFIDFGGDIAFTMSNKDLSKSMNITTKFVAPDKTFESEIIINQGFFTNGLGKYFNQQLSDNLTSFKVLVNERKNGKILQLGTALHIVDFITYFKVYIYDDISTLPVLYYTISNSNNNVEIELIDNKVYFDNVHIADLFLSTAVKFSYYGKLTLGGLSTETTSPTITQIYGRNYAQVSFLALADINVCNFIGFDSYVSASQSSGNGFYKPSGSNWINSEYGYSYYNLICKNLAVDDNRNLELEYGVNMDKPYMIDSLRQIKIPGNFTNIQVDIGSNILSVESTISDNMTSFVIPTEVTLKELEDSVFVFLINSNKASIPYFYDKLRLHEIRWSHFDTKLASYEE